METKPNQSEFQTFWMGNEAIFNFIQADVLDGLWCMDINTQQSFVSSRFWDTLGYQESELANDKNPWQNLLFPEDRQVVNQLFQDIASGKRKNFTYEVRYKHANGNPTWIRCKGLVIDDEQGNPQKIIGAHTYITKERERESALQESNKRFKNIIAQYGDYVVVLDNDLFVEELFGENLDDKFSINYQKEIPQNIADIGLPGNISVRIQHVIKNLEEAKAPGQTTERLPIILNNKTSYFEIAVSKIEQSNKAHKGYLCVIRNIDALISSEAEIDKTNRLLQDFMNASGELISIKDENLKYVEVNDAFCRFYAADKQGLIGKSDSDFFDAELCLEFHKRDKEILSGKLNTESVYELNDKFIHVRKFPIPLPDRVWVGTIANDITEKKLSEAKLKQYKELIESSSKLAKVGGWELDLIKNKLSWTEVTKTIHDLPAEFEPQLETAINFYKEGPDRELIRASVEEGMKTGQAWQVESKLITATGREIWVRSIGKAEMRDGKCVRLFGAIQDINVRKIYQEQLKFHSYMLDQIGQAVIAINPENKIIYWNKAAEDLYLWKQEEVLGKDLLEVTPSPDYRNEASKIIAKLQKGEKYIGESLVANKLGETFTVGVVNVPVFDESGNIHSVVGISHDITKEKEAQQKLKDSELQAKLLADFYKTLVENQSIFIIKTDVHGNYTFVNEFFKKTFLKGDDAIGKNILHSIIQEDHKACAEAVNICVANPGRSIPVVIRKPSNHGEVYTSKWEFKALFDAEGNFTEMLCVGVDFTELIKKQEHLEKLLEITDNQNKKLLNFNYIVSHNIRSHVANLLGLTSYIDLNNVAQRNHFLNMIKETAESLDDTIQNLSLILDIQENKELVYSNIPLKNEIERIKSGIQLLFDKAEAECNIEIGDEETVYANIAYLESILLNLMTNAIKYRAESRPIKITFGLKSNNGVKTITVSDNGRGIDMNRVKDKIFGMFKTFHGNKDAKGMGLFITKAQVEAMGGTIEVESEIEVGTTFKINLYEAN
ncbi:MAG: PAS domain S-box protein [Flavobacteriales bacterium]